MLIILLRGLGLAAQEVGLLIVHEEDKEEAVAHIQLEKVGQLSFHSLKRREVGIDHEQRTLESRWLTTDSMSLKSLSPKRVS